MDAKILAVGNEILNGSTGDPNSGWLAGRLTRLGIRVVEIRVIPDVEEVIASYLERNRDWPGLVFTMGGIGPTHDDLTRAAVARGLGAGRPPARLGWRPAQRGSEVVWGRGLGVIAQLTLNLATDWAVVRFGKDIYSPAVIVSVLPRNRREWVLVPLALGPAVLVEELLFRSLLLGGFSLWAHPLFLAVTLSIVFGLMHAPQGTLAVAATCLVGFGLSLLFLWRGSLLAPFVSHYVINLLQLVWANRRREWLESY